MKQAFLNEPTLEDARTAYLTRWHLEPVQTRWNGRKPSQAQFNKAFGEQHEARQVKVGNVRGPNTVLADKNADEIQEVLTALAQGLGLIGGENGSTNDVIEPEQDETQELSERLAAMLNGTGVQVESNDEAEEVVVERTVKPENADKLPTTGLVYFYLHRAVENGDEFAVVPVRRIVASAGRSMIAEGASYEQAIRKLRRSK